MFNLSDFTTLTLTIKNDAIAIFIGSVSLLGVAIAIKLVTAIIHHYTLSVLEKENKDAWDDWAKDYGGGE